MQDNLTNANIMKNSNIRCILGQVKDGHIWNHTGIKLKLCHQFPDTRVWKYFLLHEYNNNVYKVINAINRM